MTRLTIAASTFLGCILAANYVTTEYGMIPVGFGLVATAGTYFAGLSFVLRDTLQDAVRDSLTVRGRGWWGIPMTSRPSDLQVAVRVVGVIVAGAALSYLIAAPFIALASGAAFLASETADLAIYTPLRRGGYVRAATASNVVGAVVDTVLFLWIAGFPIRDAIAGQLVGKLAVTLVAVALVITVRTARTRRRVTA